VKYRTHHLHGLLVVDKPLGLSSMDVVRRVRRAGGHCKTGHAGTLDPLATGVLICCLGKGTKCVDQLMGQRKIYRTRIDLSAFTQTDDAEGEREEIGVAPPPTPHALEAALQNLTGEIKQTPPAYSAIKIGGRRAYQMARRGDDVKIPARTVHIERLKLLEYDWPHLSLEIECGKGTYIRSLARQIGQALGTGGHLTELRRTAVGAYTLEQSVCLDALPEPLTPEHLLPLPDPPADDTDA